MRQIESKKRGEKNRLQIVRWCTHIRPGVESSIDSWTVGFYISIVVGERGLMCDKLTYCKEDETKEWDCANKIDIDYGRWAL